MHILYCMLKFVSFSETTKGYAKNFSTVFGSLLKASQTLEVVWFRAFVKPMCLDYATAKCCRSFPTLMHSCTQDGNTVPRIHCTKASVIQGLNVSPWNSPNLGPPFSSNKVCRLSLEFSVLHNLVNMVCKCVALIFTLITLHVIL